MSTTAFPAYCSDRELTAIIESVVDFHSRGGLSRRYPPDVDWSGVKREALLATKNILRFLPKYASREDALIAICDAIDDKIGQFEIVEKPPCNEDR